MIPKPNTHYMPFLFWGGCYALWKMLRRLVLVQKLSELFPINVRDPHFITSHDFLKKNNKKQMVYVKLTSKRPYFNNS